ncbi:ribonuclease H-like domain-containing protein, partial [Tanacetum coccineum]
MTGNKAYLVEYQDYNGGPVAFGGSKGQITGKGKLITRKLDFEDVYFVKELKQFNLFSVSQMCDRKNKVLFTDSECLVLSPDFKLPGENQVVNLEIQDRALLNSVGQKGSRGIQHVTAENKANKTTGPKEANHSAGTQDNINARNSKIEAEPAQEYFVLPIWFSYTSTVKSSEATNSGEKPNGDTYSKTNEEPIVQEDQAFLEELERLKRQEKEANDAAEALRKKFAQGTEDLLLQAGAARATNDSQIPDLVDIYGNPSNGIFTNASYDDEGAVPDFTNLETTMNVNPIPTSRIHSIHPTTQILGDPTSAVQTRSKMNKSSRTHALIEPKKISQALKDESWKAIGTKWVYKNKKDEIGVVVRSKARLVAQGYRQEEGIDYDKVFAPVARMEAIRIFLAFASYMGFIVYQMDMKSAFFYGTIDGEVYVSQPPG